MASSDEKRNGVQQGQLDSVARFIAQVKAKLSSGEYPVEQVRCFCGADFNDTIIIERDRYGIPHRMVMCNECALIRANPRMTQEAYNTFYNTEYRPIYDGWEFGADGASDSFIFMRQADGGLDFKKFLDYFGIRPKVIVDVGSNRGGLLLPFLEEGAAVYGVEPFTQGRKYSERLGLVVGGSIGELEKLGVKADLIVLQDVVEHYLDLRELAELDKILAPKGHVFISTPGLFRSKLKLLFQNAHTYQFIGETLSYVMDSLGYDAVFLDENIHSIWVKGDERAPVAKAVEWIPFIVEHLEQREKRSLPPIRTVCKFSNEERLKCINGVLALKYPNLRELYNTCSGSVAIVAAGMSVNDELDTLKALVAGGTKLVVIDRMYPWCKSVGLKPDFVVLLDGSDDVADGLTDIQPGVTHIIGTSTNPEAAALLQGTPTYVYSGHNPYIPIEDLWYKHGYDKVTVLLTGGSVMLAAMVVAMYLGFRDLHGFGFDLKKDIPEGLEQATGIAGNGVKRQYFPVELENGKNVYTCVSFISFARQFFQIAESGRKAHMLDKIEVHGPSLINDMFDWQKAREQWQTSPQATPSL